MGDIKPYLEVLDGISESENESMTRLEALLSQLGSLLQKTLQDEGLRNELSISDRVWRLIRNILSDCSLSRKYSELSVRLERGVILLARNIVTVDRSLAEKYKLDHAVFKYLSALDSTTISSDLKANVYISAIQFLSNLTVNKKEHETEILHELALILERNQNLDENLLFPIFTYLNNLVSSSDFLYEALSKGHGKQIFDTLLEEYEKLDITGDLSSCGLLIVNIFSQLIVHESFLKFIRTYNSPDYALRYLKVSQVIITSKQNWQVFELTVILSWIFEYYQLTLPEVEEFFRKKSEEPQILYNKVLILLDIISTLSHFEHSRKFMLSYNCVENLVSLLGTLHQHIKPKKLKDSEQQNSSEKKSIEYRNFPGTKSLIIEILSSLVYHNFEVQEKLRELHGLELVLSNCNIDDNEPFIKERSIVCLRFLLLDNVKNQEFVAKLEAREAVQDDTIDEAGFEVKIVDGKVRLKQKPKIEEV